MEKKRKLPKNNYKFDIVCNTETIEKFLKLHSNETNSKKRKINDHSEEHITNNTFYELIVKVLEDDSWKEIESIDTDNYTFLGKYKLGDSIHLEYFPASQKYISYYDEQEYIGTIFFVDNANDNMLLFSQEDDIIHVRSYEREGCHYFGMTRGYDCIINYANENEN